MARTYRRDSCYGNIVNIKRPWTNAEIDEENLRRGWVLFDPTREWDVRHFNTTNIRKVYCDRWTDKKSGRRNAPKHFRQTLNRKIRSRANNEIRTFVANHEDFEDFYLRTKPKRDALWLWW